MPEPTLAIDASRAGGRRTGTEWYSREIIDTLTRIDDRPRVTLYQRERVEVGALRDGDSRLVVRPRRLWTHVGLSLTMLRDRPAGLFVPSHVIPLAHPKASVVTIHDLGYRFERESHSAASRRTLDITTRWNARVAREVIAISSQTRDDLVAQYGAPRSKITVVLSGVNHARFKPVDPGPALSALGIRQPYLLFLSTVHHRKNVQRIIEAFEAVDAPELTLLIAGKAGWGAECIEQRARTSDAAERIRRIGYVPDDLVPALYSGASAFLLPSLYEGFGLGIVEAMACGAPVVTSNRSSMPEVAGGAALLVDPTDTRAITDAIKRALDPAEAERLRRLGLERAASFTWERSADETLAVIRRAMAGRSGRSSDG